MAYTDRFDYSGNAPDTALAANISSSDTSITIASGTGWPTGSAGKFWVVIDPDTATEEKILVNSRSGTTLTLASASDRGKDNTSAVAHLANATVRHCYSAYEANEANYAVTETVGKVTTAGDLLYSDGANSLTRLGIGTARQALLTNAGATAPTWGDSLASLLTAKGMVPTASAANTPAGLAVGSDFQVLRARAGASNGIEWAAAASSNTVATSETTASATYTDLATSGPAVTLTTGTSVLIVIGGAFKSGSGGSAVYMSVAVSGATTLAASDGNAIFTDGTVQSGFTRCFVLSGLTAGSNTFTAKYRTVGGATGTYANRDITVVPL